MSRLSYSAGELRILAKMAVRMGRVQEVPKEELYALAKQALGIEKGQIHEFFGAAEHPVLYCTCKNHHFHIPAYARVLIRDVKTPEPLENGKTGIMNLMTLVHTSLPIMSILTDDLGRIHTAKECGCGIESDYLELPGRVGVQDVKTCSNGAGEYLSGKENSDLQICAAVARTLREPIEAATE